MAKLRVSCCPGVKPERAVLSKMDCFHLQKTAFDKR
jgi:hypothetical protein